MVPKEAATPALGNALSVSYVDLTISLDDPSSSNTTQVLESSIPAGVPCDNMFAETSVTSNPVGASNTKR